MLVLGLLTGTTTALALTQALKLERSPVTAPRFDRVFSPTCGCPTNEARLSLTLRRADTVDADVVDEDGEPVRRLVSGARRGRGVVTFVWDGSSDGGAIAPDGSYRLRMRLRDQHRTIVIPTPVHVDTAPPEVELLRVSPTVF